MQNVYLKQLDYVLSYSKSVDIIDTHVLKNKMIEDRLIEDDDKAYFRVASIERKLVSKGYLDKGNGGNFISLEGLFLLENGNYSKMQEDTNREHERLKNLEVAYAQNDVRMVLWTKIVGYATLAIFLLEFLKFALPMIFAWYHQCC